MSSPRPLNLAVIAQALHDLRNGQLRRCQAMGFDAHALEALKDPGMISLLMNAQVSWCEVNVNPDVLHRLLDSKRIATADLPSPQPLNLAVIAQALQDLRNGQLRRCQAMGFDAAALEALKDSAMICLLMNAQVPWCEVTVNPEVIYRLLKQRRNVEREIERADRMLRLGASTEMLSEFHGLTHQEVALRRQMLGLPQRKGRWPVLSEADDVTLWESWQAAVAQHGIDYKSDDAMLTVALDLAEERTLPLSVVWSAICTWIDQGLTSVQRVPYGRHQRVRSGAGSIRD